ncbi:2-hydroxyacid dehydrogenase [Halalkalibacillus halophilus]|uniref:2-hydroxyacid dehydrogenase n=1 Tax=Halalkalibacillus halophilus TaxID=392827 RepID=UPI0003FCFB05|nr:D-glycerate dehydrogenase [Halalkalibacillus halophilus]
MSKPYVYITRKLSEHVMDTLEKHFSVEVWPYEDKPVDRETLLEKSKKADALLTMLTDQVDQELFDQAENLKVVANLAVGYDNIDLQYAKSRNVTITNTPDVLTDTTADLTFGLLLATARRMKEALQVIPNNEWTTWSPYMLAGADVHHKTIGIVGMGQIGEAVAKRASGFDMKILYHNRSRKKEAEEKMGATYVSFEELLQEADYVVCMTPLTEETKDLFNKEAFQKMKSSAIFINTSRGGVVDEQALEQALVNGEIEACGLDVFKNEPIDQSHPLIKLDQVTAFPHIGSSSVETREKMMELAADNITHVLNGKDPLTPVN